MNHYYHMVLSVTNPVLGTTTVPSGSFKTSQTTTNGVFDQNVYYGFDFQMKITNNTFFHYQQVVEVV